MSVNQEACKENVLGEKFYQTLTFIKLKNENMYAFI